MRRALRPIGPGSGSGPGGPGGRRPVCGTRIASSRMASGPTRSTPRTMASRPTAMRTRSVSGALSVDRLPAARQTAPAAVSTAASRAGLWTLPGSSGRPDRARIGGTRDIVRPGHHAAAVDAPTASSIPITTSNHGTFSASMPWPTSPSNCGATAIHPSRPSNVPSSAATTPVTAPRRDHRQPKVLPRWRRRRPSSPVVEGGAVR